MLQRGVFVAPYTVRGRLVLLAIDHTGALRAQRPVPPEWPLGRAMGALEAWLDLKHPVPQLKLVPDRPQPPAPSPVDPRDYMTRVQELLNNRRKRRGMLPPMPHFRELDNR